MFKINIHNLKEGKHQYEFVATAPDFEIEVKDAELEESVFIYAELFKIGNQISVKLCLKGKFRLPCDWCTEFYIHEFNTEFDIIYKFEYRNSFEKEQYNEDDDDIKFIAPNTVFIDLRDDIRDFILLSIPMKRTPESKDGICLYCNKEVKLEIEKTKQTELNPVWEKLLKVKTK